jgi:rubrerythrin
MTTEDWRSVNRTGIALAEDRAGQMIAAVEEFPPTSQGDGLAIAAVRVRYAQDGQDAEETEVAEQMPLLMDKLGERLAFERSGTRLYEALLSKYDAHGSFEGGPAREDIIRILTQELEHFRMLAEAIEALGGDPTELTRSANVQLTAAHGVAQVLVDPRTDLTESLEAIVVAELTDNECWETLTGLARLAGHEGLAGQCEAALLTEQEHLEKVRAWLTAGRGRPEGEGAGVAAAGRSGESKPRTSGRKKARKRR